MTKARPLLGRFYRFFAFLIIRRSVNPEDLPEPLREVLGFDFWEEELDGYRTLGDPVANAHLDTKFHGMIGRLARQLGGKCCKDFIRA